jgi:hypothetical protein
VPEWQYQREKYPRLDVTRDVQQFGSLTHLHFVNVLTAVSLLHHTRFARIAVIIRAFCVIAENAPCLLDAKS